MLRRSFWFSRPTSRALVETLVIGSGIWLVIFVLQFTLHLTASERIQWRSSSDVNPLCLFWFLLRAVPPQRFWSRELLRRLLSSLAGIVPLQLLYVISMVFLQLLYPPAPGGNTYDLVFLMLYATGSTLFWLLFGVSMISLLQFWNRLRRQSLHWTLVHAHIELLLALVVITLAIFTLLTTTLPGISFPLLPSLFSYLSGLLFFFLIIIFVLFVMLAVLVPPLILFAYLVTRPTIRRIDALVMVTDKLRSGHYAVRASVEGMDEVSQLHKNFNVMANELEETIRELQTERDQVAFLLNERRELFANVSHELRTPIAANTVNIRPKGGKKGQKVPSLAYCQKENERRNFLVYRLRQLDVDDKVCEQISPGVLEKIYPTEVIEQCVQGSDQWTGTKRRVRQSTALALVLFVMMLALWSRLNQRQVWQKLVGGLSKRHPEDVLYKMSSSALTGRRAELGSQVMQALMKTCCQPIARREQTPEAFFGRYRLMAIDGTLFNVADVQVNEEAFGRSRNQFGKGAYPQVRCVLLAECGSHTVVGMQISRYDESEVHGSHTLLCLIGRNMLLLVDAGIISAGFVQGVRNRGGHVLASLPSGMWKKGPRRRLRDGSELVQLKPHRRGCYPLNQPIWVRIISYRITDERLGEVGKVYRLVTTLLNPQTAPAKDLVILYHERWEIELVIDEVKTHERAQRKVLRSRTAEGVRQELYGIFLAHYAVRVLMYEAACEAGLDPDRLSFTEGMFQLCETIPFAQIMQAQDAELIRRRLQRDISAVILPPRLLRVNRREVKQVYNRHKPKKRHLPPPESFLPEQRFEDFVQMLDPLLSVQEVVPSAA